MTAPDPPPPGPLPLPSALLARYAPGARLGEGSYSQVIRARQRALGRPVVIKLLRWGEVLQESDRLRFLAEARILAGLRHRHVLSMLDHGVEEDVAYIVYPDEGGVSLLDHLAARKGEALAPTEIGRILDEVLQGLQHVHSRGVIHRDLKPANLLVARDSSVRIFDFGLAKSLEASRALTRTDSILGTPAYMAPEQIKGLAPDPRDDLYAVGVIGYELASGRNPFAAPTLAATLSAHCNQDPEPLGTSRPDCPSGLALLIADLLAKRRDERPATAGAALEDLRAAFRSPSGTRPLPRLVTSQSVDLVRPGNPPAALPPAALAGILGLAATVLGLAVQVRDRPHEAPRPAAVDPAAEAFPDDAFLERLGAELAGLPARLPTTQPGDPLAWGTVLAASPALQGFERWVRDGTFPAQGLPAGTGTRLRDLDREQAARQLPAVFAPFARARPEPAPWEVPRASPLALPGVLDQGSRLDGWLAAAARAAEEALAENLVLNASAAPEGEEADREVVPSRLRAVVLTMARSLELIHDPENRFAYMAPEIWAWGPEGRALLARWAGRAIDATGRALLCLGLAIRHRPEEAERAALLFHHWLAVLGGFTYSAIACRDPDFVLGGPPTSPAGHAVRAALLDRRAEVQARSPRGEGLEAPPSWADWEAALGPGTGEKLAALATAELLGQALGAGVGDAGPERFLATFRARLADGLARDPARRLACLDAITRILAKDGRPGRVEPLAKALARILWAAGAPRDGSLDGLVRLGGPSGPTPSRGSP